MVGRPADFSGAVGSYRVAMRAHPTTLQAEEPLTLTLRITGTGPLQQLGRPNLSLLPAFNDRFQITNLDDRYLAREKAREFDYCLRPRSPAVKQIPPFRFVYFKPGFLPEIKGFQTAVAPAIPLTVTPRTAVGAGQVEGKGAPPAGPASVIRWAMGPAVLRREEPFSLPGPLLLALLLAAPPLACGAWYAVWQRLYPDAARLARQRRSRAARQALRALAGLGRLAGQPQAVRAEAIVVAYLQQRLDLATVEPTPTEVAVHLRRLGLPPALVEEAARFFEACDAARFAPGLLPGPDPWPETARRLILALEAEPWASQSA